MNTELETVMRLAQRAGKEIMSQYGLQKKIELKEDNTPVTEADKAANRIILEGLVDVFPHDGIISEEMETITGDRSWYVDPLDGTKGFINRTDQFAIHIGLAIDAKPVFGLIYKPTTGEAYYGIEDEGAFYRGLGHKVPLHINRENPDRRIAVVGISFTDDEDGRDIMKKLTPTSILHSGSEGLRIMKLVENIGDLHLTNKNRLGTWDVCAPQAILEAAGGVIVGTDGKPIEYVGQRKVGRDIYVTRTEEQKNYMLERLGDLSLPIH